MLGLPGYKTVSVSVYDLYITSMSRHWGLCHGVPLPFYKNKLRNGGENGGKWHVATFLDNYFPFFSNVHSKGLFAEQIIQAKTSPPLSLDTYVLGNQSKFSPNPSVEKFRHVQETGWDAPFLVFLPSLLPSSYSSFMCAFTLTRICAWLQVKILLLIFR